MSKITKIVKRSGDIVAFNPERITNAIYRAAVAVGGRDKAIAEGLTEQVVNLLEEQTSPNNIPTVEDIQDLVEKVLIENGHAKVAKAYILYRDERARHRQERAHKAMRPSENIPWAKIWHVLDWAVARDLHTIEKLNGRIANGEMPEIVADSEKAYLEDIEDAVEMISEQRQKLRIVIISGPSSSGKTTTTIKIGQRLAHIGLNLVTLNVDNYFFDLDMHPKDEFGDFDFETPQALDLPLINEHLSKLIAGNEILIPYYDFKTGKRTDNVTPMHLDRNDVLLIDSLHGLYEDMTSAVPQEQKFKVYLEPLLQMKDHQGKYIRWTDIRLMRRMLRDASHRAYKPTRTLEHWHYVRSSELRNIIPMINSVDFIINSAMPFELPIFAARLIADFNQWIIDYKEDPLKFDAYTRASRIQSWLQTVFPLQDDSFVPGDSVIREFIGGSIYHY